MINFLLMLCTTKNMWSPISRHNRNRLPSCLDAIILCSSLKAVQLPIVLLLLAWFLKMYTNSSFIWGQLILHYYVPTALLHFYIYPYLYYTYWTIVFCSIIIVSNYFYLCSAHGCGLTTCNKVVISSWQVLYQLQQDEDSSTGGDGIILQKTTIGSLNMCRWWM